MQEPYVTEPATMTTADWAYLSLAFLIFSISLAIVRRQASNLAKKTNVKKAIKNRFGRVFGGEGNAANAGGGNNANDSGVNNDKLIMGDGDDEAPGKKPKVTYTNQSGGNLAA